MKYLIFILAASLMFSFHNKKIENKRSGIIRMFIETKLGKVNHNPVNILANYQKKECSFAYYDYKGRYITLIFDSLNATEGQNEQFLRYWLNPPFEPTTFNFRVNFNGNKETDGAVYRDFKIYDFRYTPDIKTI